jgi:hypothetical protein
MTLTPRSQGGSPGIDQCPCTGGVIDLRAGSRETRGERHGHPEGVGFPWSARLLGLHRVDIGVEGLDFAVG